VVERPDLFSGVIFSAPAIMNSNVGFFKVCCMKYLHAILKKVKLKYQYKDMHDNHFEVIHMPKQLK